MEHEDRRYKNVTEDMLAAVIDPIKQDIKYLKSSNEKIYSNLDSLTKTVIRLEESVKGIPIQIIATLPKELYNNCTRILPIEKAVNKIESNNTWIIRTILGFLIAAILALVIAIPKV